AWALAATPAGATAPAVAVPSTRSWTETGITVRRGDVVAISARGQMHLGTGAIAAMTPAGIPWGAACDRVLGAQSGWIAPGLDCWSLIGRIGTGKPFAVGFGRTFTAPDTGALVLGVNDDYFGDNAGSWSTTIVLRASNAPSTPPPPAAGSSGHATRLLLLLVALAVAALIAGCWWRLRRRRRAPVTREPMIVNPTAAPPPDDVDVNIFEVTIA